MKTILTLLLSCLSLSAATTYPVLSTTTTRTIAPTEFGIRLLTNATAAEALALIGGGAGGATNVGNGADSVLLTNSISRSSGTTNWAWRAQGTNGADGAFVNKDGGLQVAGQVVGGYTSLLMDTASQNGLKTASGGNQTLTLWAAGAISMETYPDYLVAIGNAAVYGFSLNVGSGNPNTALGRVSDGLLQINNYTSGTYRDLVVRSLYATNIYVTNIVVGGGSAVTKILTATATLDFGNILAAASADLTITVTGAAVGDSVFAGPPAAPSADIAFDAFVSATDTVTVRSHNVGAIGVDQASATFRATVVKF